MLELSCSQCNQYLFTYQKDGPGPLLRCYWDRIHFPEELKKRICQHPNDTALNFLVCQYCEQVIGEKGMYEKEHRLVFILVPESFSIKQME